MKLIIILSSDQPSIVIADCLQVYNTPMRSTSKKVKISVLSSSGQVKSKSPSLSQIRLARIAHEKSKARETEQEGKRYSFHPLDCYLNCYYSDIYSIYLQIRLDPSFSPVAC